MNKKYTLKEIQLIQEFIQANNEWRKIAQPIYNAYKPKNPLQLWDPYETKLHTSLRENAWKNATKTKEWKNWIKLLEKLNKRKIPIETIITRKF